MLFPGSRRQHAQDGERERALAGSRLADNAQGLAGMDAQRHIVDPPHDTGALGRDVVGRKVFELEQRRGRHKLSLRLRAGEAGGRT